MKLHRLAWVAGFVGLPLAHYWLAAQIEPFYSSIYCFLWWSYIFVVDFAICRLRGQSLLRDQPREFLFLSVWSVPVWLIFEMANLRLKNWYYVMSPCGFSWATIYLILAFATVLPGIFETTSLVLALIEKFVPGGRIPGRPFVVSGLNVSLQLALGILMLILGLAFPKSCFCLVWGFAYFLTDPICYWVNRAKKDHTGRSLLGQLAAGNNTRLVALLLAGFICGGLWEAWNLGARTKWIYSVPFFDELKLGEIELVSPRAKLGIKPSGKPRESRHDAFGRCIVRGIGAAGHPGWQRRHRRRWNRRVLFGAAGLVFFRRARQQRCESVAGTRRAAREPFF
jgi:hypothetical protein